jgi:hypothetical protein
MVLIDAPLQFTEKDLLKAYNREEGGPALDRRTGPRIGHTLVPLPTTISSKASDALPSDISAVKGRCPSI